jgi:hypothetical protein
MTGTTEVGHGIELAPPTPRQIDALIAQYAEAQKQAQALGATALLVNRAVGEKKDALTALVEKWGARHTEKSKRLEGHHNTATTTTASKSTIDDAAVEKLRVYLGTTETPELAGEFFVAHTSYSLVSGPDEKLKTLTMATRLRTKVTGLIKDCFKIKTGAPSLKVELAELKSEA